MMDLRINPHTNTTTEVESNTECTLADARCHAVYDSEARYEIKLKEYATV